MGRSETPRNHFKIPYEPDHFSSEERIQFIKKDSWIGYPRATEALAKLHELYEYPNRQRMPNLLIIGPLILKEIESIYNDNCVMSKLSILKDFNIYWHEEVDFYNDLKLIKISAGHQYRGGSQAD